MGLLVKLEEKTQQGFRRLGTIIAEWSWTCVILCILAAIFLSVGAKNFREVNDVRDHFSADNSPSRYEFAIAREFFKELGKPFYVVVAMQSADGGSVLRPRYIDKALEIEDYLQYKLKVTYENRHYSYSDLCGAQCETSDAVNIFLTMYRDVQHTKKSTVKLTFPTIDIYGHRIYLANNIFKVQLNNRSKLVEGAGLITINFNAIAANKTMIKVMKLWEHAVLDYVQATQNDPLIRLCITSEGLVAEEIRRTGVKALPLMPVTFSVIVIFTMLTSLKRDPVLSKPWEAFVGVLCPCLSLCASFGTLFWLEFEFLPIVTVVPFLILAIGVDDVFIFLHSWARTDKSLPLNERVGEMLSDAGPSITITSLTNWLSFAIGIATPIPAIRIFCIFISVSVIYDYVYQVIFYTAIIKIGGRREELRLNAYAPCIHVPNKKTTTTTTKITSNEKKFNNNNNNSILSFSLWLDSFQKIGSNFVSLWVDFAVTWPARILLAIALIAYWIFTTYGVFQIKVGLSSEKLFLDDSPLLELVRLQTNIIFKEGGQMAVFVNNPGDLRKPDAIPEIMRILDRFEHATLSVGSSSTQMWLNPYLPFVGLQNRGSIDFKYKYLPEFFSNVEFHRWSHFVSLGNPQDCYMEKPSCINKYFFSTGFRNAVSWSDRLILLTDWRLMAQEYPQLNLTIYEDFSMYSDQLQTIPPITIQTVCFALLCMTLVLIVFTPHLATILPGVACVLSINLGVFGLLFYWDIDLDPISMTTTLMAIGLSVDFVAHISFHFYKGEIQDQKERLRHALLSIAWPMIQAALSTVLSLLILATIHAYMVQVFVKVVTIVVFLGLIHGLVVLPIVYASIPFHKTLKEIPNKKNSIQSTSIGPIKIAIDNSPTSLRRFKLSKFSNVVVEQLSDNEKEIKQSNENNQQELLCSVTRGKG